MAKQEQLFERIRKGESAIAKAKAEGRDVTDWERHLEAMKLEAHRLFPGIHDTKTLSCDVDAGEIVAVEIASEVLGADIWLAFRDDFDPQDGKAIFYAHELYELRTKTPNQLREIHKVKLAFGPGSKVRQ
jgi:hypothetical protein